MNFINIVKTLITQMFHKMLRLTIILAIAKILILICIFTDLVKIHIQEEDNKRAPTLNKFTRI